VVGNLLDARQRAVKITVRPEPFPHGHHYTVEWQYLRYDAEARTWESLQERQRDDDSLR
jgi:hypothetical protein